MNYQPPDDDYTEDFCRTMLLPNENIALVEQSAYRIAENVEPFDWMNWDKGREAITNPDEILSFTSSDAEKLVYMLVRERRFAEGDFSINGIYVDTEHSFFGSLWDKKVLHNLAKVFSKGKVQKCDICHNGHMDGIKTIVFPGHVAKFCSPCGKTTVMKNPNTLEEKTLFEIWKNLSS